MTGLQQAEQPSWMDATGQPDVRRLSAAQLSEIRAAAMKYMTNRPDAQIMARMWLYLAACGPSEAIAMVDEILTHRSRAAARAAGCDGSGG